MRGPGMDRVRPHRGVARGAEDGDRLPRRRVSRRRPAVRAGPHPSSGAPASPCGRSARRVRDDALIATAEFVFVCVEPAGPARRGAAGVQRLHAARRRAAGEVQRLTVNGVSLAVEVRGEGPAVLFIHGYPMDRSIWAHQMAALDGWRRIAPDLRGMGQSDAPDLGYSMETYAADLAALLDLLGVDDVVLVRPLDGRLHRVRVPPAVEEAGAGAGAGGHPGGGRHPRGQDERGTPPPPPPGSRAPRRSPRACSRRCSAPPPAPARRRTVERVRAMMAATPVAGIVGALGAMRDRPDSTAHACRTSTDSRPW